MSLQPIEPNTLADATVVMANFNDLQTQITALALRVAACETNITTLTASVSSLTTAVAELSTRVTALEEKHPESTEEGGA